LKTNPYYQYRHSRKSLEKKYYFCYAKNMTLSGRNNFFKGEVALAFICLLIVIFASLTVIPSYSAVDTGGVRRAGGIFHALFGSRLAPNFFAVHLCIALSSLYALVSLVLIYYFFEKTQSPEILFISFFTFSLAFEAVRLILPLRWLFATPSLYLRMASRVLIFARYFGLFSLFAASVYAAGLEIQKQRNTILVISVAALIISLGIPIDIDTWDTNFNMVNGYTSMFRLLEAGTFIITVVSFFIGARARGTGEYFFISAGVMLAFAGRNILLNADTWAGPLPGLLLLSAGTWLSCTRLHKVYLWL
jgi:hypothetical protein